jgi:putative DNA primase/helicase
MPTKTTDRLTHDDLKKFCQPWPGGSAKEWTCPLCGGKLALYKADEFLCVGSCDPKKLAALLYELRDAKKKKPRPSTTEGWQGLTPKDYCAAKRFPLPWFILNYSAIPLGPMQGTYNGKPVVEFAYMDIHRKTIFRRFRESMDYGVISEKDSEMVIPYGLWTIRPDKDEKWPRAVVLCEGESDQQTLTFHKVPALGVPGVKCWRAEWAKLPALKYAEVIFVIQEPPSKPGAPDVGKKFVEDVRAAFPGKIVKPLNLAAHTSQHAKDPSALHLAVAEGKLFGWENPAVKEMLRKPGWDADLVKSENWEEAKIHEDFMESFFLCVRAVMKTANERRIVSVLAADVEMKLTKWLWRDHIPLGTVTVFAGMPDMGKSTAATDVDARLSTGANFPFSGNELGGPCEVAVLASEDDINETLKPRLVAADGDSSKVHFLIGTVVDGQTDSEMAIALDTDLDMVGCFLKEHPDVRQLRVDPVTAYLGIVNPDRPREVRPFLQKLLKFARKWNIGILLVMHLAKNVEVSALYRVGGAATWVQVPRSVWFFAKKEKEEGDTTPPAHIMVSGKGNLVADDKKKALEFRITSVSVPIEGKDESIGRIEWGAECETTLEEQMGQHSGKPGPEPKKMEAAKKYFKTALADGAKPRDEVFDAGLAAGHKKWTLTGAAKELKLEGEWRGGVYYWMLPAQPVIPIVGEVDGRVVY